MSDAALRILLVAPDGERWRALLAAVEGARFDLACAPTLRAAVERLGRQRVDVLVLDPDLPDARGPQALARLRRRARHVPVVVLGGGDDEGPKDGLPRAERLWRMIVSAASHGGGAAWSPEIDLRDGARTPPVRDDSGLAAVIARASNDLRGPVCTIGGLTSLLLEEHGGGLDAEGRALVERTRRAALRLDDMLAGLGRLALIAGAPVERVRLDAGEVAARVLAELARGEPGAGVAVRVGTGLFVSADPTLLELALEDLLAHVWRCGPSRVEVDAAVPGTLAVRHDGTLAGAGAFAPFPCPGPPGLAAVRCVAERHGGRAWIDPHPDGGATIFVALEPAVLTAAADGGTPTVRQA